jgi:hypothetical protein
MVAGGATNREAAAALFVSPKTIEAHLGRVYAKLGIHSRTKLAVLLAAAGAEEVDEPAIGRAQPEPNPPPPGVSIRTTSPARS